MKILVKFPSRERHIKFNSTLRKYIELSAYRSNIHYVITLDDNDPSINHYLRVIASINNDFPDVQITAVTGISKNKIDAINRDMEKFSDWDILVNASDDMIPQHQNWDMQISYDMDTYFPDTDGALWFHDGYQKRISTMVIVGKKYFERFNYIYNNEYISLWCDNEYTEVGQKLGKLVYVDFCLFKHEHYSNNASIVKDRLMFKTESYYKQDETTYNRRKLINFGLPE